MSQPPPPPPSQPPGHDPQRQQPEEADSSKESFLSKEPKESEQPQASSAQETPPQPGQPPQPPAGAFGSPPAQPPQGGYGYPQQPPQTGGGYGYPQQPPGAPQGAGYGFPQQPPGAPGGYGFPQQPPQGYGYPQQPGQPPYGQNPAMYPTQPPGGYPGGPGAPGGDGNGKIIAIIAAAVAVVLVIGTVGFFLIDDDGGGETEAKGDKKSTSKGSGGGGKPASTEGEELFKIDSPKLSGEDSKYALGGWATDEVFAKGTIDAVVGMDAASGDKKWDLALDGEICAASKHMTESGKTAVITQETKSTKAACNQLAVFDVNSGKKEWQEKMPAADDATTLGMNLTIAEDVVAAKWIGGSVAYKISGGSPLWRSKGSNECRDDGFAGGKELMAVVECGDYSDPKIKVQKLDPKTGKSTWEFEAPDGVESARVISTRPRRPRRRRGHEHRHGRDDRRRRREAQVQDLAGRPQVRPRMQHRHRVLRHRGRRQEVRLHALGPAPGRDHVRRTRSWPSTSRPASPSGSRTPATAAPSSPSAWTARSSSRTRSRPTTRAARSWPSTPTAQGKQEVYLRNPDDSAQVENDLGSISLRDGPLYVNGRLFLQRSLVSKSSAEQLREVHRHRFRSDSDRGADPSATRVPVGGLTPLRRSALFSHPKGRGTAEERVASGSTGGGAVPGFGVPRAVAARRECCGPAGAVGGCCA